MWRLWNKLFGWQYALINSRIVRYIETPRGNCIYKADHGLWFSVDWDTAIKLTEDKS